MTTSDVLRKLIRACVDDGRTLRNESKFVAKREQPHDGSWGEFTREAERDIWVAGSGGNNGDAIASSHRSQARTEAAYDVALRGSWPDEIQRVLAAQRRRLREEPDELNLLQF